MWRIRHHLNKFCILFSRTRFDTHRDFHLDVLDTQQLLSSTNMRKEQIPKSTWTRSRRLGHILTSHHMRLHAFIAFLNHLSCFRRIPTSNSKEEKMRLPCRIVSDIEPLNKAISAQTNHLKSGSLFVLIGPFFCIVILILSSRIEAKIDVYQIFLIFFNILFSNLTFSPSYSQKLVVIYIMLINGLTTRNL